MWDRKPNPTILVVKSEGFYDCCSLTWVTVIKIKKKKTEIKIEWKNLWILVKFALVLHWFCFTAFSGCWRNHVSPIQKSVPKLKTILWLGHPRFPALNADCLVLLWVPIGYLWCFPWCSDWPIVTYFGFWLYDTLSVWLFIQSTFQLILPLNDGSGSFGDVTWPL